MPEACTTRAGSSIQNPGEIAASKVPVENNPIARMKTVLVEIRCSRKPVIGMTTAMVSMNAVVSHCTVRALISRSTIRRGSATLMIVSLRITTNVATSNMPMICRSRVDSRAWEAASCWLVVVDTKSILTLSTSAYGPVAC